MGIIVYRRGPQVVEVDETNTDQRARMGRDGWEQDAPEPVDTPEPAGDGDGEEGDDLDALTRPELDARAAELGIADAGQLPNKPAVIDAIRAATAGAGDQESTDA